MKEDKEMLNTSKTNENGVTTFALEGRLDTVTSPEFESELKEALTDTKELILDFANLDYISSAGLRVLLAAQKIIGAEGQMKLINVNETIMEIFEVTGFTDILTIE